MLSLAYVRVSSIEQEQGFGLQVQREALQAYAAAQGLPAPEIIEESASAESIVARVELQQVLARAKAHQEEGGQAHVLFFKLDRLARNLIDQESMVQFALKYGVRLHSTVSAEADSLNPAYAGDPIRVAIRQFFGIFSQLERSIIQARLDSGLAAKAREGGATGGRTAFGYISRDDDIIVNPPAAPIVRLVFALHAQGLDQAGIAAVAMRQDPVLCGHWTKCQVSRVLRRERLYRYGEYKPRLAYTPVIREELRILVDDGSTLPPLASGPVEWKAFPDPMATTTLGIVLGRSKVWIERQIIDLGLPVRWAKGRQMLSRTSAARLEQAAAVEVKTGS